MNQQFPKRYPRTQQRYVAPRGQQRPPNRLKKQSGIFLLGFLLIGIICIGFVYKKKFDSNKQLQMSEDLKNKELEEIENIQVELVNSEQVFEAIKDKNVQLIDIREQEEFNQKHIETSINVPFSQIDEKIHLISKKRSAILIDRQDSQSGKIFVDHLKKEGVDVKYLEGGILNYSQEGYNLINFGNPAINEDLVKVDSISADEVIKKIKEGKMFSFLDVRKKAAFTTDNIEGSINIPLEELEKRKDELPFTTLLVYDSDAIRSFQAAVRLYDMNIIGSYNCIDEYQILKSKLQEASTK